MLSEKSRAKQLDCNNKRRLQKIAGKFIYYSRAVDPTMLMALNSLSVMQKKPTIVTVKQVTRFLNYSATHPDTVKEYRTSGIILHIYSDASCILEPES